MNQFLERMFSLFYKKPRVSQEEIKKLNELTLKHVESLNGNKVLVSGDTVKLVEPAMNMPELSKDECPDCKACYCLKEDLVDIPIMKLQALQESLEALEAIVEPVVQVEPVVVPVVQVEPVVVPVVEVEPLVQIEPVVVPVVEVEPLVQIEPVEPVEPAVVPVEPAVVPVEPVVVPVEPAVVPVEPAVVPVEPAVVPVEPVVEPVVDALEHLEDFLPLEDLESLTPDIDFNKDMLLTLEDEEEDEYIQESANASADETLD
jgi:hypothetical protein